MKVQSLFCKLSILGLFVVCFCMGSMAQEADEETNDYIHYRLGIKYKREKNYDLATEEFRKVLAAYPDNYNAYMHLADISEAQGRPRQMIYNLKKALTYNPGWGKAHKMLAQAFEIDGQYQKSIMELQLYQQTCDPAERESVQSWINKLIEKVTGKNPDVEQFVKNTTEEPSVVEAEQDKNVVKKVPEKKKVLNESQVAMHKSNLTSTHSSSTAAEDAAFSEGVRLYGEQKWDDALVALQKCLTINKKHPGAYYYAGLVRRRMGQNAKAKYNFERSYSYPELGYNAHYYLGKICAEENDYPSAIKHLEEYISLTAYEEGKESARGLITLYKAQQKENTRHA